MTRLKELRKERGLLQKDIANYLQIAVSTYSYWEQGTYEPDNQSLNKLAEYFDVSVDYLLGRTDDRNIVGTSIFDFDGISPIATHRIPMLGDIACGEPIYADEDRESYVLAGTDINADFCLTARGDSMIGARIHDGDIVFCRSQSMVNNGEIAVVIIDDSATLKRVYYYPEKKKLVLQAENPKYEPFVYVGEELDTIRILGKAIAFQSDIK